MDDVTEIAALQVNVKFCPFNRRMGRGYHRSEFCIFMGNRRAMALDAVFSFFRRMMKSSDFPCAYTMTGPAVFAEQTFMGIQMTVITTQLGIEKGMIHSGNLT